MKKIVTFILLLCMVFALSAYAEPENAAPEITLQEIYDAGKDITTLLGDHESVYFLYTTDGKFTGESYWNKEYDYSYFDHESLESEFDLALFSTDHSAYFYSDNIHAFSIMITPDGMVDIPSRFAETASKPFLPSTILEDTPVITEKDGAIYVTFFIDQEEFKEMGIEDVVSCEETYILDAETREILAENTVYTYTDGRVEESSATITRDAEIPENMKVFLAYEQETEMRTVTIISNPGTENEKTESIQAPKGVIVGVSADWDVEATFTLHPDAACTQTFEDEQDVNSDLTIYVKWSE